MKMKSLEDWLPRGELEGILFKTVFKRELGMAMKSPSRTKVQPSFFCILRAVKRNGTIHHEDEFFSHLMAIWDR